MKKKIKKKRGKIQKQNNNTKVYIYNTLKNEHVTHQNVEFNYSCDNEQYTKSEAYKINSFRSLSDSPVVLPHIHTYM